MALRAGLGRLDYTGLQRKGCDWNHTCAGGCFAGYPILVPALFARTGWDFDFPNEPSCFNLNASDLRRKPDLHQPRRRIAIAVVRAIEHVEFHLAHSSSERAEHGALSRRTVLHVDECASRAQPASRLSRRPRPDVPNQPRQRNHDHPEQNCRHGSLLPGGTNRSRRISTGQNLNRVTSDLAFHSPDVGS
jgi:hypothetical protein